MGKKTAVVLFGGQSSEHVVSCMSAANVAEQIDTELYDLVLVGITEEGHWLLIPTIRDIRTGKWTESSSTAVLSPDATEKCLIVLGNGTADKITVDVVFPVLHGLYGEDGTIQGLLELAQIPYVGCGVLASAVSMDKLYTKVVVDDLGICQARYVPLTRTEIADVKYAVAKVEDKFAYPVFIKPSNAGSSRGVTKAVDKQSLIEGLQLAAEHDRKVLVEETIIGHEIECAVLGHDDTVKASPVGEVLAAADFYDFEAKYYNEESRTVVNPILPGDAAEQVRQAAMAIFKAVDGYGLSRVDFFVQADGKVVFNEINTLPGFTAISMYPMLWEAAGISKKELVQALLEEAFVRYQR